MGRIKKTDEVAKTAEAWWALFIPEGSLGRAIYQAASAMIGAGVFAWAAQLTEWMHKFSPLSWVASATVGLALTLFITVQIEALRLRRSKHVTSDGALGLTEDQAQALISAHLSAIMSEAMPVTFATHAQMHAQDEKIVRAIDEATAAKGAAQLGFEYSKSQVEKLQDEIGNILSRMKDMEREWEGWTHQHAQNNDHRFRSVDGGFRALRDRETLLRFSEVLTTTANWLLRTSEGEKVDDWGLWNHRHFEWRRTLTEYSQVAARYLPEIAQSINEVPTHTLKGEWPEERSLFPSDDAMIEHRTTAVIMRNFSEHHPKVIACVESFAFQAPSMKLIPEG